MNINMTVRMNKGTGEKRKTWAGAQLQRPLKKASASAARVGWEVRELCQWEDAQRTGAHAERKGRQWEERVGCLHRPLG